MGALQGKATVMWLRDTGRGGCALAPFIVLYKYKSGLGSDEPTQQIYSTKISIPSTQNSISQ
jgi:hypothetical protein